MKMHCYIEVVFQKKNMKVQWDILVDFQKKDEKQRFINVVLKEMKIQCYICVNF